MQPANPTIRQRDAQDDEKNVHRCIVSVGEDDSGCSLLLESVVYDNGAGAACAHRREPYIVGCEAALLDGFGAVFQSSEVGIDIVCTECEFDSTCFGATDNLETGNPVACIDFQSDSMLLQYIQYAFKCVRPSSTCRNHAP